MMTLDEEIKRCEEIAETQEWMAGTYDDDSMGRKLCNECAEEHRQLAEWLRELKDYRERMPSYEAGYNDAIKEIALSGEYERAYQRGYDDGYCKALEDSH